MTKQSTAMPFPVRRTRAPSSSSTKESSSETNFFAATSDALAPASLTYSSRMEGLSFMSLYRVPITTHSSPSFRSSTLTAGTPGHLAPTACFNRGPRSMSLWKYSWKYWP